jgi:hypothetical protein
MIFRLILSFATALAQVPNWDPSVRQPFRGEHISACRVLLSPNESGRPNDGVGIPIGVGHDVASVRKALEHVVRERGRDILRGAHLYITGVPMGREKTFHTQYSQVLTDLDLQSHGLEIKILSIPRADLRKGLVQSLNLFWQKFRYSFPSLARNFQRPLPEEVTTNLISDAIIESPNFIYLFSALAPLDAGATVIANSLVLMTYDVFSQTVVNWLNQSPQRWQKFVKQMAMSVPFVMSYSVFGQFSDLLRFIDTHSSVEIARAVPGSLATFAGSQGLTVFLQTAFFATVIAGGLYKWQGRQVGEVDQRDSRTVVALAKFPLLIPDAFLLGLAASPTTPSVDLGPLQLNVGQAALALYTLGTFGVFNRWPDFLTPVMRWYQRKLQRR